MHEQMSELLTEMRKGVESRRTSMAARIWDRAASRPEELLRAYEQMDELLTDIRKKVEGDWEKAQDAISTLVRTQAAQGLAALFMKRKRPYEDNAQLTAMMQNGLLTHAAFIQKAPRLLNFYKRLLFSMERPPESVFEIGVKGGGSTAFWKALFPAAAVVGMDIKLQRSLASEPSEDGVIYLQGDQTDAARLNEIADRYGPFDVVIDDGSHVTDHQAMTMRCLLRRVRPGGVYVIEDINASVKKPSSHAVDYGADIWSDFTATVFQQLRKGPLPPATAGGQLARDLIPLIDDLIMASRVLAVRVTERPSV